MKLVSNIQLGPPGKTCTLFTSLPIRGMNMISPATHLLKLNPSKCKWSPVIINKHLCSCLLYSESSPLHKFPQRVNAHTTPEQRVCLSWLNCRIFYIQQKSPLSRAGRTPLRRDGRLLSARGQKAKRCDMFPQTCSPGLVFMSLSSQHHYNNYANTQTQHCKQCQR